MSEKYQISSINRAEFERYTEAIKPVVTPIEQSPLWAGFESKISGREPLGAFKVMHRGRLVAIFSATLYKNRGRDWVWIKHGPLFASVPTSQIVQQVCSGLKSYFSRVRNVSPVFIRLSSPTKITGLKEPFEHTMYDQTVVVDLTKDQEELFLSFSQSVRQAVKKARRLKVEINELSKAEAVKNFDKHHYLILTETAKRAGFKVHPASLYKKMLEELWPNARLYEARYNDKVVAWAIVTEYQDTATYYYSASNQAARESEAQYLLQWQIITDLRARGLLRYDLMGIAGKHSPHLASVTGFKKKFAKNSIDVPQTYDLLIKPLAYYLITAGIKLRRRLR